MAKKSLIKLLREWQYFKIVEKTMPDHILRKERRSIAKAVSIVVQELKETDEYDKLLDCDKQTVEEIIDFFNKDNA